MPYDFQVLFRNVFLFLNSHTSGEDFIIHVHPHLNQSTYDSYCYRIQQLSKNYIFKPHPLIAWEVLL